MPTSLDERAISHRYSSASVIMIHLSDRRRAECAILPRLLLGIANDGGFRCYDDAGNILDGAEAAIVEELKAQLNEASVEPISGLDAGRAAKLARRIDRLAGTLFHEWRGASAAKWALALMIIVRDLFAPMLEDALDDPAIYKSAVKQARHLRDRFVNNGYFRDAVA